MPSPSSPGELLALYAPPIERARIKTLRQLDHHCRRFIELSPFLCLGTQGPSGGDVSPRGDEPGFVHVLDAATLGIPDWPGNNRLDSLHNLLENPAVGLLFLIPGVNETLRVNGQARIETDPALLALWDRAGKRPKAAIVVQVREAYLHCGKALLRSKLWNADAQIPRAELPTYGAMLKDQITINDSAAEIQESVETGYRDGLY